MADIGRLKIHCFNGKSYIPVDKCIVTVSPSSQNEVASSKMSDVKMVTDSSGLTNVIDLASPPKSLSEKPLENVVPYGLYDLKIERNGFEDVFIKGVQIFSEQVAIQNVAMPETSTRSEKKRQTGTDDITILPNTLNGVYPEKIPEAAEKPLPPPSSGVVLEQPVVPEYIIVHQGSPNDNTAPNYKVDYKDYIKNVASCEIYSTWPETTIRANIYCIISFTLNRIYTEWYRGKGKNFDITSSTAYDHAFNYGRNIYENIGNVVDEIFSTYIKRFSRKQPLLTQYCDGKNVKCPQWLSQWGSKYLGDQGKVPYEILTYYYGNDIELKRAEQITGSPSSYPGYTLTVGASGNAVKDMQGYLNTIAKNYPLIPIIPVDGYYGNDTAEAVRVFQQIFSLPITGTVDYATWYQISNIYVGVTKIAELRGENIFRPPTDNLGYRSMSKAPYFAYPRD